MELNAKEKQLKIANVVHQNKVRQLKKDERTKFIGSFMQAKNLIEKQMKIGVHIKDKKKEKARCKKIVKQVKTDRRPAPEESTVLKTKIYGGFEDHYQIQDLST